jgi:hypothetical protein
MPKQIYPSDIYESSAILGIDSPAPPASGGIGSRQSRVPSGRRALSRRQMLCWLVPEQPIIQMYINPEQLVFNYGKQINETRTKGGFSVQYWGENLTTINGSGTTGTSGIEGMNILLDIYRNEQLIFDPYALFMQAEKDRLTAINTNIDIIDIFDDDAKGLGDILQGKAEASPTKTAARPSLASLATGVEMYWMGEVYRGFFKTFVITESAQALGLFSYSFNFTVTQKRGIRNNFLAWHKSPNHGPSDSSQDGPPHSFSSLILQDSAAYNRNASDQPNTYTPFVDKSKDLLGQVGDRTESIKKLASDTIDIFKI